MPQEVANGVACIIAEAIHSTVSQPTRREQTLVLRSLESVGPTLAQLPFDVDAEHFNWSVDYVEHLALRWGAVFKRLMAEHGLSNPTERLEEVRSLARRHYLEIAGEDVDEAALDRFNQGLAFVESGWFAPGGKFPLSEKQRKELLVALRETVEAAERRIQQSLQRLRPRGSAGAVGDEDLVRRLRAREAVRVFPVITNALESSTPGGFWEQVMRELPEDYEDTGEELMAARRALQNQRRAAFRRRAALDEVQSAVGSDITDVLQEGKRRDLLQTEQ